MALAVMIKLVLTDPKSPMHKKGPPDGALWLRLKNRYALSDNRHIDTILNQQGRGTSGILVLSEALATLI